MGMLAKIRRMHLGDGLSIREVSRRTGQSTNTVKRWLRQEGVTEPKYPQRDETSVVDAWAEHLTMALQADARSPVRDPRTGKALFEQIQALSYQGRYPRVVVWARRWRRAQADAPRRAAFVPMSFEMGDAFHFDWICQYAFVGGLRRRREVAHTKLAASRAFWLTAYPAQEPRDAVRRLCARVQGLRRHPAARNLRMQGTSRFEARARTLRCTADASMAVSKYLNPKEMIMTIATVGIDLAKNVFAVHAVGKNGLVELKRPPVQT